MNDETTNAENPVGLYHDPASGQFIGAIDPIQADAMIQQGWKLFTPVTPVQGKTLQQQVEELSQDKNLPDDNSTEAAPVEAAQPEDKKGKK